MSDTYRVKLRQLWIVGCVASLLLLVAAAVVFLQVRGAGDAGFDAVDANAESQKLGWAGSLLGWAGGSAAVSVTCYFLYLTTSSIAAGHDALTRAIQSSSERAASTAATGLNLAPQTIRSLILQTHPSIEGTDAEFIVTPKVRLDLLAEAIRRDPALAEVSDPDGFRRLGISVAALQEEFALRHELEQLRSAQEAAAAKELRAKEAAASTERAVAERRRRAIAADEVARTNG